MLQAPYRTAHTPQAAAYQSAVLGQIRYRIDTVFGQLTDRCQLKRVWARDLWNLRNRIARAILMHTLCAWLNQQRGAPCLQLDHFTWSLNNLHIALVMSAEYYYLLAVVDIITSKFKHIFLFLNSLILHRKKQVTIHKQRDSNITVTKQLLNDLDIHFHTEQYCCCTVLEM